MVEYHQKRERRTERIEAGVAALSRNGCVMGFNGSLEREFGHWQIRFDRHGGSGRLH